MAARRTAIGSRMAARRRASIIVGAGAMTSATFGMSFMTTTGPNVPMATTMILILMAPAGDVGITAGKATHQAASISYETKIEDWKAFRGDEGFML